MKVPMALCFAMSSCAVVSGSLLHARGMAKSNPVAPGKTREVNRWIVAPVSAETISSHQVTGARGGATFDVTTHKALWVALGLNLAAAVAAAVRPDLIASVFMTTSGISNEWCTHLLAITLLGGALHTLLSLQDGSLNVLRLSRKVNMLTLGLVCAMAAWQYSQGVFDNNQTIGFIAITGLVTAALAKKEFD